MGKSFYICIDFDGTIVDHRYPDIGPLAPFVLYWLEHFKVHEDKLILFTMRSGKHLEDAVEFLHECGIELFGINRNPDQDSWTDSPKAYGHIYIDDAAIGCPMIHPEGFLRPCVDWNAVGNLLEAKRERKING
jgi:hypothetical protein